MSSNAIYPGTFDPLTNGHLNLIERSAALFESVIVAVAKSSTKSPLFSLDERLGLAEQALSNYPNVRVLAFEGLLIHIAEEVNADVVVRGVRSIADFEYEAQMAAMNKQMKDSLETIFLTPDQHWASLSSTLVRDIARHGGAVTSFVPESIEQAILQKLKNK